MTVWRLERSLALRLPRARARSSSPLLVSLAGPPRPPSSFLMAREMLLPPVNVSARDGSKSIEKPRSKVGSLAVLELGMVMVMRSEER